MITEGVVWMLSGFFVALFFIVCIIGYVIGKGEMNHGNGTNAENH